MLTAEFYATLVKFVQAGGIGFGAIVFLLSFILLLREKPIEPERARLQTTFMQWGVGFSIIAIGAGLAQNWLQRPSDGAGHLVVTYSPKLTTAGLPVPDMLLLSNTGSLPVVADSDVSFAGQATLKISADDLIAQARNLQTAKAIVANVAAAASVAAAPSTAAGAPVPPVVGANPGPATGPAPGLPAPVATVSAAESNQLKVLQFQAATSLAKGDFATARIASDRLEARLQRVAPAALAASRTPS